MILTSRCSCGELAQLRAQQNFIALSFTLFTLAKLSSQSCKFVLANDRDNFVHGDLHAGNLLFDEQANILTVLDAGLVTTLGKDAEAGFGDFLRAMCAQVISICHLPSPRASHLHLSVTMRLIRCSLDRHPPALWWCDFNTKSCGSMLNFDACPACVLQDFEQMADCLIQFHEPKAGQCIALRSAARDTFASEIANVYTGYMKSVKVDSEQEDPVYMGEFASI